MQWNGEQCHAKSGDSMLQKFTAFDHFWLWRLFQVNTLGAVMLFAAMIAPLTIKIPFSWIYATKLSHGLLCACNKTRNSTSTSGGTHAKMQIPLLKVKGVICFWERGNCAVGSKKKNARTFLFHPDAEMSRERARSLAERTKLEIPIGERWRQKFTQDNALAAARSH